jgi:hypothetical protein
MGGLAGACSRPDRTKTDQDNIGRYTGLEQLGCATGGEVWRSSRFKPQLRSWGGRSRRVLQQICRCLQRCARRVLAAVSPLRLHVSAPPTQPCELCHRGLRHAPARRTWGSRDVQDKATCCDTSTKRSDVVRTCASPAAVSLVVCLRRAFRCAMTALPCVVRSLREERIASRRRIRVGRGREGYVQRLLYLLLRLLWLLRLCRGRIGRVSVCGRRLVVWVMSQMAIWRARERRRGLTSVHGVASQFGSSSTRPKNQECSRSEECRPEVKDPQEGTTDAVADARLLCRRHAQKTVSAGRATHTAHRMQERESIPCPCTEGEPTAAKMH